MFYRHRNQAPKFSFLFGLVTTVYVGTGSLLEPSFGTQPYTQVTANIGDTQLTQVTHS